MTMQRRRRRSRGVALIVGGIFAAVLAVSFFFDEMGLRKYVGMLQHARELQQDIQELERANAELRLDISRIQHDPARIEELARERLGFVKKGDTVYQLIQEPELKEKGQ
jgi:cell division protein FtsB